MTRRILAVLESRATYGYSKNVMLAMEKFPELELCTLVTGMHLIPELGNSIELIKKDGFPISATVPLAAEGEGTGAWPRAMGNGIALAADVFEDLKPDIVIIFGDRVESFSMCIAASYAGLPVAHVQAGDKSGHIDDIARMALAKLAHIHLASCEDSAERVRRLGEQGFRIHNVGAPQLDDIVGRDFSASEITIEGKRINLEEDYLLLVQHPVMVEREEADVQMRATLEAVAECGLPVIWVYPNSDLGFGRIVDVIEQSQGNGRITHLMNLERDAYLTLMANASALVGNSSSGILEAPSFKVPVVNIGNRQRGRPQADNILNCGYEKDDIKQTILKALNDEGFKSRCTQAINPYGDGKSSERICQILTDVQIDHNLMDKQTVY